MTYEKFRTQLEIKSRNETTILKALSEKPMRFRNLKEITELSQMGLTTILKRLQSENKIEKTLFENHEAYRLTKNGQDYLKRMWMILYEICEMQSVKTNYNSNYFSGANIKWSLLTEIESPYIDYRDFIRRITEDYLRLVLLSIKERYLITNDDKTYSISNSEEIKGKHIVAFEVDFDSIRENLEYALQPAKVSKAKEGKNEQMTDAIKENIRNIYRNILFNEKREKNHSFLTGY